MEKKSSSRRDFLRGAALLGVGAVGASLAACTPSGTGETGGSGDGSAGGTPSTGAGGARVTGYCGPGDWLGTPPEIAESDITETIEVELVILGSGHSGVGAAFSAADEGLTFAVIEQQPWSAFVDEEGTGENKGGWYGEDIGHVNSQFLIDRGFGPYNTGEILTEFTKRAGGRVNPDIIKAFVQNSGPMFDRYHEIYESYAAERQANDGDVFLTATAVIIDGEPVPDEGNFDMSNLFEYPLCNTQACHDDVTYPVEGGGYKTWPCNAQFYGYQGNNIEYVHKYMVKHAQEHGGTYYFEHTGVVLTTDSSGAVTGLIAQDAGGAYKKFVASKGVLLAAGDYIGNPEMCWALLNEGMEWAERAGSTAEDWAMAGSRAGVGHKMACWAGGMIEPSPRGWMALGGGPGGPWGSAPLLQLDVNGERYMNEASIAQAGSTILRLPVQPGCWVSDANWGKTIGKAPLDHGAPNFGIDDYWTQLVKEMGALKVGPEPNEVISAMLAERKMMKGMVFAANTLDELAGYLGYSGDAKQAFLASITHYNELCASAAGDTDYGKDTSYMVPIDTPPFIGGAAGGGPGPAVPHSTTPMMVTLSGLITDKLQNVLNKQWEPIKGLYACGNCLGGRYGMGYNTPFAGNSVGMAITHGYTAAKNIAKQ
ncbi:MAG: FAD-binding protein [Coriobacteriales bacterium]|jgi:hypothetical protein|nr:FAD-binding protein [Coriobacteriales bacterium]